MLDTGPAYDALARLAAMNGLRTTSADGAALTFMGVRREGVFAAPVSAALSLLAPLLWALLVIVDEGSVLLDDLHAPDLAVLHSLSRPGLWRCRQFCHGVHRCDGTVLEIDVPCG